MYIISEAPMSQQILSKIIVSLLEIFISGYTYCILEILYTLPSLYIFNYDLTFLAIP